MTFRTSQSKLTFPLLQTDFGLLVIFYLYPDFTLTYRLEDLWLNDNQIESLEAITEAVTGSKEKLTTIYLENNPCVSLTIIKVFQSLFIKFWSRIIVRSPILVFLFDMECQFDNTHMITLLVLVFSML